MIDNIAEIIYDEEETQKDNLRLTHIQKQRIEHFEAIGKPWLADAIRTSNGLQPKHPEPKRRKTSNFDDIRVDDNTRYYDDFKITSAPGCSVEKAMRCLEKINTDKFI